MADKVIFEQAMAGWNSWQEAPWGRLRYEQAEANLARHLEDHQPLRILDVAGGNGEDAIRLARRGHHVTVVDYSSAMLEQARHRSGGLITTIEADVLTMPLDDESFDVVLCHNLVQYFDSPADVLPAVLRPLKKNGLLSLASVNRETELLRLALHEHDPAAALATLDAKVMSTKNFGTDVNLSTPDEMCEHLHLQGMEIVAWYGIRAICDYVSDDELKHDPEFFDSLRQLEMAVADRDPYRRSARMYQIIGLRSWKAP